MATQTSTGILILITFPIMAGLESGPYAFDHLDVNSAGLTASAGPYEIVASIGQPGGVGILNNGPYQARNGFWYAVEEPPQFPADRDFDGDVDGIDFSVFASCFNKAGNPPRTLGCDSGAQDALDFDDDGDIDGIDFSSFASCFNKAGNPPRTPGCPQS